MSFTTGLMPIERPKDSQSSSRSAHNSPMTSPLVSPAASRRGSVSSIGSAYTDSGVDRYHYSTAPSSVESTTSSKSGFRSFFSKKEKKPKQKIVITSKHAAAVRQKLLLHDPRKDGKPAAKTAGVVGTVKSAHLTAADQEARHPHSGPPALHARANEDMPVLTRIASADEIDEEDEFEKNERLRAEYAVSKQSMFTRVAEHESDESAQASAEVSADEGEGEGTSATSPLDKPSGLVEPKRPSAVTRSSFGGRFHRDESGAWRR